MTHNMQHLTYLRPIAEEDLSELERKEATYKGSWKKRGGLGAFMMAARKWDRLEEIVGNYTYDIFAAIQPDMSGQDGSVLAEVRDLRRYLLLIEAEMIARASVNERHIAAMSGGSRITETPRLDDGLQQGDIDPDMRGYYMGMQSGGRGYHIVDRRKTPPEMWDHLARLSTELNNTEYQETLPEYQGLYRWDEGGSKWAMREQYREHWGDV